MVAPNRLQNYSIKLFPVLCVFRYTCSIFFIVQIILMTASPCLGQEIIVRLSGKIDYPGDLSIIGKTIELRKVCFLGIDAKGAIDKQFLRGISSRGIPLGIYEVSPPFPDEKWPVESFVKNGALRLKFLNGSGMNILKSFDKNGIAIHGRDFYPLLDGIFKKNTVIHFHNNQLFERLKIFWGPLRISNWDMGRMADSWIKMNQSANLWKVKVVRVEHHKIEKLCKPPITKRTLD